jgi:hypothetical protein
MTDAPNHHASDRVLVDLIEADVVMAFGLVGDAREEFTRVTRNSRAALDDTERVLRY